MQDLQVCMCPVGQLVAYPRNARTHSPRQIDSVAASIQGVRLDQSDLGGRRQ